MLKKTFELVKTIQQRKQKMYMVPGSVLEFNHPDEVFNKFYDSVYQKWSRRSHIWTHSLGLISSHKRIHDQWLFSPQKKKCGK